MHWETHVIALYKIILKLEQWPYEDDRREDSENVRGGSRAATTSKMEPFVRIVNGWKPLTIITKRSILIVVVALDPPLNVEKN